MKVIQFTVPVANEGTVVIQEDILPYFYNYFHRHKEIQITLIIKGEGTLIAGNYTQPFKAEDIYIIGPDQPHMFKGDGRYFENLQEKNIHAIHIFFDPKKLQEFFNLPELEFSHSFISSAAGSLQLSPQHCERVGREIKKICRSEGFDRLMQFTSLLRYFAVSVNDWKSLSTGFSNFTYSDSEGIRMNDIYQYTIENFTKDIPLSKIAGIAYMTPHSFCKYFKKHTRRTYISFLNEIRINEACKILLNGHADSISSIAYQCGFNSAITFNKVFKKVAGMCPSDYHRQKKLNMGRPSSGINYTGASAIRLR